MTLPNPLPTAAGEAAAGLIEAADAGPVPHIIDQLIAERSLNLARNPLWQL